MTFQPKRKLRSLPFHHQADERFPFQSNTYDTSHEKKKLNFDLCAEQTSRNQDLMCVCTAAETQVSDKFSAQLDKTPLKKKTVCDYCTQSRLEKYARDVSEGALIMTVVELHFKT